MTQVFEILIGGLPITLKQDARGRFTVRYWKQVKAGLSYTDAAKELGACIMHAAACDGRMGD